MTSNITLFPRIARSVADTHTTGALNHILRMVECPARHRPFIDLVVGQIGERDGTFSLSDTTLAHTVAKPGGDLEAARDWVRRHRRSLREWQSETGIIVIKMLAGDRTKKKVIRSRYSSPAWTWARQAAKEASNSREWIVNPNKAIENAAEAIVKEKYDLARVHKFKERPKTRNNQARCANLLTNLLQILENDKTVSLPPELFQRLIVTAEKRTR